MKAVSIKQPGEAEQMEIQERDKPIPKVGELLVEVRTAALNRTDIVTRSNPNLSEPYPILGVEIAGVVVENRGNGEKYKTGTRVAGLVNQGGYAEYAILPANRAILLPESMSFEQGAAIPEVFLTAYQTLYWLGELKTAETVLIHAGASGVGTAAIQMAKHLTQARVIVTAGSAEKLAVCQTLGADKTINYKEENFAEEVLDYTDQAGVDVILDFIGASYWENNLKSIKKDGRWVLIGTLGGATVKEVDLSALLAKRVTLKGTLLTPRSDEYKAKLTQEFVKVVLPYFKRETIHPIIDTTFQLEEVVQAHQYMEDNKNIGKIILKVRA
ncbi:MAG: NAD(P)H-quinone oxidoreductase [Carnobacterium sp.]|uniref:NAD(P)H-quinone oxidoreductase n=1 Tax=Carnobacterium antarcticum TaxID=2126436 RepID=A0ABW4NNU1_9LACT|nr:NAD(P)H-quinone oxidoreductase [Carnobacterium sp. CP1]ALV22510.1 Quinone oxidoreductase [Carnobacterium sp. CP1]